MAKNNLPAIKSVDIQSNLPTVNFNVESLISKAIDKGVDVATMEKLLVMAKEMQAIRAKQEFDNAMAAFQAECPIIDKDKDGGKTDTGKVAYKYAPIDSIVRQVKSVLQKHGFSYSANMELIENGTTKVKASIKVTHIAGHSETTEMTVPLGVKTRVMSDTQVVAAAQTFAKRYAFCNAFGILTGDEDTDSVVTSGKTKQDDEVIVEYEKPARTQNFASSKPPVVHYVSKEAVETQIKNALSLEQILEVQKKMQTAPIKPEYIQHLKEMIERKITDFKTTDESPVKKAMLKGMKKSEALYKAAKEMESKEVPVEDIVEAETATQQRLDSDVPF